MVLLGDAEARGLREACGGLVDSAHATTRPRAVQRGHRPRDRGTSRRGKDPIGAKRSASSPTRELLILPGRAPRVRLAAIRCDGRRARGLAATPPRADPVSQTTLRGGSASERASSPTRRSANEREPVWRPILGAPSRHAGASTWSTRCAPAIVEAGADLLGQSEARRTAHTIRRGRAPRRCKSRAGARGRPRDPSRFQRCVRRCRRCRNDGKARRRCRDRRPRWDRVGGPPALGVHRSGPSGRLTIGPRADNTIIIDATVSVEAHAIIQ